MSNLGIKLEELKELLSIGHEAVLSSTEKNILYSLSTQKNLKNWLCISQNPKLFICAESQFRRIRIQQYLTGFRCTVGKDIVEQMLSQKCIGGKSFLDLIEQIHVEEIF